MLLHISCLELVILGRWVVVIPPDTATPITVDAGSIRKSIFLRAVKHFGHERPGVVKNGSHLYLSVSLYCQCRSEIPTSLCLVVKFFTIASKLLLKTDRYFACVLTTSSPSAKNIGVRLTAGTLRNRNLRPPSW